MSNGLFITFEGGEGAGKSLQLGRLASRLKAQGHELVTLREPGGVLAGEAIRSILLDPATGELDPLTELFLFSAARREVVSKIIEPALDRGAILLCDRFADSTMAYQGYGRGVDRHLIAELTKTVCGPIVPDLTLLLDLPVEEGLRRSRDRLANDGSNEGRFEAEQISFHNGVREGFLAIAAQEPQRVVLVDASDHMDQVTTAINQKVDAFIAGRMS